MKDELMNNGPVVSVSFQLKKKYVNQLQNERVAFAQLYDNDKNDDDNNGRNNNNRGNNRKMKPNHKNGNCNKTSIQHELLIVGWSLTPYGEAWNVQYLYDNPNGTYGSPPNSQNPSIIKIGFGQFNIDTLCLAPKSNLEHISWQNGPYFDVDFSDAPQWRKWLQMDLPASQSELILLGKCFEKKKGMFSGDSFVIRDREKLAHSASYVLKNLRFRARSG